MEIRLIAVGRRMPDWVTAGFENYRRRLPKTCRLGLTEIAPGDRRGGDSARATATEDRRMTAAIGRDHAAIALDAAGQQWSSEQLARQLSRWLADGRDRALLIGGADGLGASSRARAEQRWALSALTLPHALVRVVVAEQIYRAYSLLNGHPYHRG